nr:hypothetical protein [Lacunisphaera sp.]
MKLPILALTLALLCPALRAAEAPLADVVRAALSTSANQYEWMLAHLPADAAKPLPRTFDHGRLVTVPT